MSNNQMLTNRIQRARGQLEGVLRMIQDGKSCDDVVMQLMAARSAIEKITLELLAKETNECARSKSSADRLRLQKLAATLFKYT